MNNALALECLSALGGLKELGVNHEDKTAIPHQHATIGFNSKIYKYFPAFFMIFLFLSSPASLPRATGATKDFASTLLRPPWN